MDEAVQPLQETTPYADLMKRLRNFEEPLSFSSFSAFARSPKEFIAYKFRQRERTEAMVLGDLLDTLLTEPEMFDEKFVVAPKVDRRTKAGKIEWEIFQEQAQGRELIKQEHYDLIRRQCDELYGNSSSRWILENTGTTQASCEWEYMGFKWRGRRDFEGDVMIADLKRTADAHPRKMRYKIREMRYDWQGSFYTDFSGATQKPYYILAIDANMGISVIEIDRGSRQLAADEIEHYMKLFKRCIFENAWNASYDYFAPHGIYQYSRL
ncbi:PD-(D/E)XK nuclease-like domain-containing protein [Candidatus Kaiserbacteria bacterium]|nr:PD-(D/E)XK nuclease-like domain-containing protein [Candidatus Kaiserbacteria bacterium]